jgi:hypothetical protein
MWHVHSDIQFTIKISGHLLLRRSSAEAWGTLCRGRRARLEHDLQQGLARSSARPLGLWNFRSVSHPILHGLLSPSYDDDLKEYRCNRLLWSFYFTLYKLYSQFIITLRPQN